MKDCYRELLKKYISHVTAAQGDDFAMDCNLSPCVMGDMEFNTADKLRLENLFQEIREERGYVDTNS